MTKISHITLGLALAVSVAGCGTTEFYKDATINRAPGTHAPSLMADVRADQGFAWTSDTFGPVPIAEQGRGDASCRSIGWTRAIGFHPEARGLNDVFLPGGGFYCS